jgi:chorismate mutase / prephenate dehydratase
VPELKDLRRKVDALDDQILQLLSERAKVCRSIGNAKKQQGTPIRDAERETEVYRRVKAKAASLGLDSIQVEQVYREIVNMCSSVQE